MTRPCGQVWQVPYRRDVVNDERPDAEATEPDRRVPAEPLPVHVEMHGEWWPGWLSEWQRWPNRGWMGFCTWTIGVGQTHMMFVPEARVRKRVIDD